VIILVSVWRLVVLRIDQPRYIRVPNYDRAPVKDLLSATYGKHRVSDRVATSYNLRRSHEPSHCGHNLTHEPQHPGFGIARAYEPRLDRHGFERVCEEHCHIVTGVLT
jgi:hypothetical protein